MFRSILVCAITLIASAAHSQSLNGPYIGLEAGGNFSETIRSASDRTEVATDTGPVTLMDLGWGFGNGLRLEIEGNYRSNNIANIKTTRVDGDLLSLDSPSGQIASYSGMLNALYEFNIDDLPIHPYVGAGIGYSALNYADAKGGEPIRFPLPGNNTVSDYGTVTFNHTAGVLAYQAIAGASMPIGLLPGLEATAEYRYFATNHGTISSESVGCCGNTINGVIPSFKSQGSFNTVNHSLLIGIRYAFGAS
jgi:opacity protein-like surface antigen